jgi:alkanesulfonate monooxygenase SsuD/methylene tetrahydromethanopterin reductase-like flavin-dependent oxidoreductase (luciferase family)
VLLGGTVPASFARVATEVSEGWVAPLFGLALLRDGAEAVGRAWSEAGREGRPRIVTGRYFSLGPEASKTADQYIHHYYGADFFDLARPDTLTDARQIHAELHRLSEANCDEVVLYPCSGELEQISLLARIVRANGTNSGDHPVLREPAPSIEIRINT